MIDTKIVLWCAASVGVGVCVSTGYPIGIVAAVAMPPLVVCQPTRRDACRSAFCYYAGALWPLVPAARNFFGPSASLQDGVVAWFTAALLLATPWPLVWTTRRVQFLWRVPLALFVTVVPPLGLIGWASPLTAAGFVFPGTGWIGLLLLSVLCGGISAALPVSRIAAFAAALLALFASMVYPGERRTPAGWEGVNTFFGGIAHSAAAPTSEYLCAQWIQNRATSSQAHVIVFPETVVPQWTDATDLFWQQTLATLSASGKTILVGAGLPGSSGMNASIATLEGYDFSSALEALRADNAQAQAEPFTTSGRRDEEAYQNAVVIRGAHRGTFIQRIPVPLGMWHPFGVGGVPLNLSGRGVIRIGDQRAAILICYEQLLTWPMLVSMLERPTVLVAVANDYWVEQTPIPRYQASAVRGWARLFALPTVSAVNR